MVHRHKGGSRWTLEILMKFGDYVRYVYKYVGLEHGHHKLLHAFGSLNPTQLFILFICYPQLGNNILAAFIAFLVPPHLCNKIYHHFTKSSITKIVQLLI